MAHTKAVSWDNGQMDNGDASGHHNRKERRAAERIATKVQKIDHVPPDSVPAIRFVPVAPVPPVVSGQRRELKIDIPIGILLALGPFGWIMLDFPNSALIGVLCWSGCLIMIGRSLWVTLSTYNRVFRIGASVVVPACLACILYSPVHEQLKKHVITVSVGSALGVQYEVTVMNSESGACLEDTSQFFWVEIRNNSNHFVNVQHINVEARLKGDPTSMWTPATIVLTVPDNVYHLGRVLDTAPTQYVAEAFEYPSLMTAITASIDPGKQVVGWIMTKPLRVDEYSILVSRVSILDSSGHTYVGQVTHKTVNPKTVGADVPKGGYFSFKQLDPVRFAQLKGLQFCNNARPPWMPVPVIWK